MVNFESNLKQLAAVVQRNTGITYSGANIYQLENRVNTIVNDQKLDSADDFFRLVLSENDQKLLQKILDLATNNETSFFRDENVFTGLTEFVIRKINENSSQPSLSIWSAACSTGQELYSIIMQLEKARSHSPMISNYSIFASDISDRVVERARNAKYSELEINRGISQEDRKTYFTAVGNGEWQVRPEFRRSLTFKNVNLLNLPGVQEQFDIIFCRNVLIYQTVENKKQIVSELAKKIKPGGFLILGGAESLFGLSDQFESHDYNRSMFYEKKTA